MPETLEALLWCAALATWLIVFFQFIGPVVSALWKGSRRHFMGSIKAKTKG